MGADGAGCLYCGAPVDSLPVEITSGDKKKTEKEVTKCWRGPPQRRSSLDRGYGDRAPPIRREDDRYGGMDRDRYCSSTMSDRRPRGPYPPSPPPRSIDRDPVSSYRDYGMSSRDYSPPRERISSRDYVSSRDIGLTRSSYDTPRDSYSSKDSYSTTTTTSRRDDYLSPRDTRDYATTRDSPRDYIPR